MRDLRRVVEEDKKLFESANAKILMTKISGKSLHWDARMLLADHGDMQSAYG